ncbi:TPA: hypothetical protein VCU41_000543 [Streptococcus pyogenes]|nr:hypothetical protein [Streptococcus pyogenes]
MFEDVTLQLPKNEEKKLMAHYYQLHQEAIEEALAGKELWKPYIRMSGLSQWLDVSTTTIVKWQREGMPHIVIDGVTLYDKRKIATWLNHFERNKIISHEKQMKIFPGYLSIKHVFGTIITYSKKVVLDLIQDLRDEDIQDFSYWSPLYFLETDELGQPVYLTYLVNEVGIPLYPDCYYYITLTKEQESKLESLELSI